MLKTLYSPHGGKLSIVRVLSGEFGEGTVVQGARSEERAAAAFSLLGQEAKKRGARQGRRDGGARTAREDLLGRDAVGGEGRRHADQGARAARARLRRRHRRQGPQGRGEAHRRAGQADGGGPLAAPRARQGHAPDGAVGAGRDAPARGARAAQAQVRRGGHLQAAPAALQGDDQEGHRDPRPAQEAVGRPRTVRRRRARHQAAAARLGLPVRREDHGRRGAALSSSPRSRSACRTSCSTGRSAASRWSTWR